MQALNNGLEYSYLGILSICKLILLRALNINPYRSGGGGVQDMPPSSFFNCFICRQDGDDFFLLDNPVKLFHDLSLSNVC